MDKDKRQRRIGQKLRHQKKQVSLCKAIFKDAIEEPHRYAKKSFATCGNPNCFQCGNPRKFFGCVTIQEQKQSEYAKSFERYDDANDAT